MQQPKVDNDITNFSINNAPYFNIISMILKKQSFIIVDNLQGRCLIFNRD